MLITQLILKKILSEIKINKDTSVLEFNFSNFLSSIAILFSQIKYFLLFYFYSIKEKDKKKKDLFVILAIEFLNLGTKKNLNLLYNFRKILDQIDFSNLIIPFEGYSWERLLIKETKNKNKKIKCLGYHFSAISQFLQFLEKLILIMSLILFILLEILLKKISKDNKSQSKNLRNK